MPITINALQQIAEKRMEDRRPPTINYDLLVAASTHYAIHGYKRVEAPWIVNGRAMCATSPADAKLYSVDNKFLVASGEQSFLQLIEEDLLPHGDYQCVTPCFRDDVLDEFHHRYFLKLELITYYGVKEPRLSDLSEMKTVCMAFFRHHVACCEVQTDDEADPPHKTHTSDIVSLRGGVRDIELGSYGVRRHPTFGNWIYGTGVALPRLSQAKERA